MLKSFIRSVAVVAKGDVLNMYYIHGDKENYLLLEDVLNDVISRGRSVVESLQLTVDQEVAVKNMLQLALGFPIPEWNARNGLFENKQWQLLADSANDVLCSFNSCIR